MKKKNNKIENDNIDINSDSENKNFDINIENYDEEYDEVLTKYENQNKLKLASDSDSETEQPKKDKKIRKVKKKKSRKAHIINTLLGALAIISISVMLAVLILYGVRDILGIYKEDKEIQVVIPQNSNVSEIAKILEESGVIKYSWLFRIVSSMSKEDTGYQYGMFILNSKFAYTDIIQKLHEVNEYRQDTVSVTFKEGWTLRQYAEALEENGVCGADDFIDKINHAGFGYNFENYVEADRLKFNRMEGFAFPNTYEFYLDSQAEVIAKKILGEFNDKFTEEMYERAAELNMTVNQIITLASMIQAEAGDKVDSKKVSSVFHNRLLNPNSYPRLESDPTAKYALNYIKPFLEGDNQEMLDAFDTYNQKGLPPGPICNPGITAIEAALYPEQSKYFFFCSNIDTKEFYYAETFSEHINNLKKAGLR